MELQLRVAAGEPLPLTQADVRTRGHAIEARVYAENPVKGFLPATGRLHYMSIPEGDNIRVDSGVRQGDEVSIFYDPMIAKVCSLASLNDSLFSSLVAAHHLGSGSCTSAFANVNSPPSIQSGRSSK